MTATVLPFPDYAARDAFEFERFGTSSYTRAIDEAIALVPAARAAKEPGPLRARADALAGLIGRLAIGRPEMVGGSVILPDGELIKLRDIPAELAKLLKGPKRAPGS